MSAQAVEVTRDVPANYPHNYLGRDVNEGEVFYLFTLPTYGCINERGGVALSERPDEYPYFEFPADAVSV